jgi:hypothetical protein
VFYKGFHENQKNPTKKYRSWNNQTGKNDGGKNGMDDDTLLRTLKNGVMIAGHEMGPVGDHWPAIHAISKGLDEEFDELHKDEAVLGEYELHLANALREMEDIAEQSPPREKKELQKMADDLWQRYYAIFEPIDSRHAPDPDDLLEGTGKGKFLKAAAKILKDMGVTI